MHVLPYRQMANLLFLGARIGKAQAHDGPYPDHRVLLVHKVVQQGIGRIVLMLHPAIQNAHRQQRPCMSTTRLSASNLKFPFSHHHGALIIIDSKHACMQIRYSITSHPQVAVACSCVQHEEL